MDPLPQMSVVQHILRGKKIERSIAFGRLRRANQPQTAGFSEYTFERAGFDSSRKIRALQLRVRLFTVINNEIRPTLPLVQ
jgi:hypothetical protein